MEPDREEWDRGRAGAWVIALVMTHLAGLPRVRAGGFMAVEAGGCAAEDGVVTARAEVVVGDGGTGFPLPYRRAGLSGERPQWRRRLGLMQLHPGIKR